MSDARKDRDEGMGRVMGKHPEWVSDARQAFRDWYLRTPEGYRFTGEKLRHELMEEFGLEAPPKPQCWSAVFNSFVRSKELPILFTGEMEQPRDRKSHARWIKVYQTPLDHDVDDLKDHPGESLWLVEYRGTRYGPEAFSTYQEADSAWRELGVDPAKVVIRQFTEVRRRPA